MKHAGPAALDQLEPFLARIRAAAPELKEKSRGTFYRGSRAFLHFHEDPAGMFADARLDGVTFERFRATTVKEQQALLSRLRKALTTIVS